MNFIAILLALAAERFATQVLHWRELRWFDRYFDAAMHWLRQRSGWVVVAGVLLTIFLASLPVIVVTWLLAEVLHGVLYICFAATVLFFSLGPHDLLSEAERFISGLRESKREQAETSARAIMETHENLDELTAEALSRALLIQSCNQIFGVLFWFAVFGPIGAWAFRVADLFRRRTTFESERRPDSGLIELARLLNVVHGVISWLPSRLSAVSFALAGSYVGAIGDWREYYHTCSKRFFEINEDVVACAGVGAMEEFADAEEGESKRLIDAAEQTRGLVWRTLVIWIVAIAALVIVGSLD